jgi:hypothetical protein
MAAATVAELADISAALTGKAVRGDRVNEGAGTAQRIQMK